MIYFTMIDIFYILIERFNSLCFNSLAMQIQIFLHLFVSVLLRRTQKRIEMFNLNKEDVNLKNNLF